MALCLLCCGAWAQTSQNSGCTLEAPSLATSAPNIFNEQQEQDLGDALAEYIEPAMRMEPASPDDLLTRIGERLLAALPPTNVRYRFRIYDSGEINAYSTAGGRVYVSRKLIAAVQNEDQLAAVVAHEIGHIRTHQSAIEFTRLLRVRLGITQVTDRADIFAKVHLFMDSPAKAQEEESEEKEEKGELVADAMGLYALVRAGYAAESFPSFFNLVSVNKGKTGSWFSDTFGYMHGAARRYRAALKMTAALPGACKGRQTQSNPAFEQWRQRIVSDRMKTEIESVAGDRPIKLEAALRPTPWRVRFSPDGRFVLVQDDAGIAVVEREKGKHLLRIEAPDAEAAHFTPDSASVVFHDSTLRVERWSVATAQRTSAKELVVFDGCYQTALSPDGKTLACINIRYRNGYPYEVAFRLMDVESGKLFYEVPDMFLENLSEYPSIAISQTLLAKIRAGINLVDLTFSPDGRYLVAALSTRVLAYDLDKRMLVTLDGKLKGIKQARMAFLGPDQLVVTGKEKSKGMFEIRTFSFPDGRVLSEGEIGLQQFEPASKGRYLIIWPLEDLSIGLFDMNQSKVVLSAKHISLDAWDKLVATEDASGGLAIEEMGESKVQRITLPVEPLPAPRAAAFSPDGKYLAVSIKNRAEIWDLETGMTVKLIRPFSSAWIDENDRLFGFFPKFNSWDATELQLTLAPFSSRTLAVLGDTKWQYRGFELGFKSIGGDKSGIANATLEVKKMESQALAWKRDYSPETPASWPADGDRMVLVWPLSFDTARTEIESHPRLQQQANALKDRKNGMLLETVVPETGAPLQQVIIPEVEVVPGWRDPHWAYVSGDVVLAPGKNGSTRIYSLDNGAKAGEFVGMPMAASAALNLIAAVNRDDEILLLDERNGNERQRFSLGSRVIAARIVGKEKLLLVLTADQVVHRLPLPN
jgi:WD40 repeat protein